MSDWRRLLGAAEVVGAVALVVATVAVDAFADMALAWRVLAVFMAAEGLGKLPLPLGGD